MDFAFLRSRSGIQESSLAEYPFHRIRKDRQDGGPLWHKIRSISYSSSPAIRSGGGFGKFGPCTLFHDREIREWRGRLGEFSKSLGGGAGRR